jgi:hypothetical protein
MKEFLHTLDQYADRQVDLAALRRSIEQQLSAMPAAAPDILAAIAAAERAGKIDAGETQGQAEWLRSRASVQPRDAKDPAADHTQTRIVAEIQAQPPSQRSRVPAGEREPIAIKGSSVGEGSVLKSR